MTKRQITLLLLITFFTGMIHLYAQEARIYEEFMEFKTYPFSDPDPVPEVGLIYPYFYFHGYTNQATEQEWKMIVLENEFIKVFVCPDIGGKIWGAIEKSTGKEFLYYNHVVKFRDVGMRGAWTSGGLEYNFGDIGHIPTCSTPVDYVTRENKDGSVSCIVGATDLPSGTRWSVEIRLDPDKAFFETKSTWFNNTSLPSSYYHWMNAAAKASGNLEFIYPGSKKIGHDGDLGEWSYENNRELSWYENNDFGGYKSYHVINAYSDFYGGYWHDDDFGFGHYGTYDDKPGKKLWIWGLSDQGMIWEDLLTDSDGQYIEYQAGKLFNQAAGNSTITPFKHREFHPHDADVMHELWFPLKETEGMVAATRYGVLNVEREGNQARFIFSALQSVNDLLVIYVDGELRAGRQLKLSPLELHESTLDVAKESSIKVVLGDNKLVYSSLEEDLIVDRPLEPNPLFNWESAYGQYVRGLEYEKQRMYLEAMDHYKKSLEKDPGFLPALSRMAQAYYRQMEYDKANEYVRKALAIDTYDGEANYIYGLLNGALGKNTNAKSGFSIAMMSVGYRSAASSELSNIFLQEGNLRKAEYYAEKALASNDQNLDAIENLAIIKRKQNLANEAAMIQSKITYLNATHHFSRFENYLLEPSSENLEIFRSGISNELPYESYLDLAISYYRKGCVDEASSVLEVAPDYPIIDLWLSFLDDDIGETFLKKGLSASPYLVFPHRSETGMVLTELMKSNSHWKLNYYQALVKLNLGLKDEALALFNECGEEADFAPFYLARAELEIDQEIRLHNLNRAKEIAPRDWRVLMALADYYLQNDGASEAVEITGKLKDRFPEQPSVGLSFAKSLLVLDRYDECISFLEEFEVLPFEGATNSRDIYHESCIRASYEAFRSHKYRLSIEYAEKARKWPVNLGVGRPYDVDEGLEDFLIYIAYSKLGKSAKARSYKAQLLDYNHLRQAEEDSKLFLQLLKLWENERQKEGEELLQKHFKTCFKETEPS